MTMTQTKERRDLARGGILAEQNRQIKMRQRDLDRRPVVTYQPGDLVLLWRFTVDKDKGRKLEAKWEGPYQITIVLYCIVFVARTEPCEL